jgi:hypothetical protein
VFYVNNDTNTVHTTEPTLRFPLCEVVSTQWLRAEEFMDFVSAAHKCVLTARIIQQGMQVEAHRAYTQCDLWTNHRSSFTTH